MNPYVCVLGEDKGVRLEMGIKVEAGRLSILAKWEWWKWIGCDKSADGKVWTDSGYILEISVMTLVNGFSKFDIKQKRIKHYD